jgi:hypothetical protein
MEIFLGCLCPVSLFALVFGGVALILNTQLRARIKVYQELARSTGLTCEVKSFLGIPTSGQVVGTYKGYSVRLGAFTRRYYRTTSIYTFVNVSVANPRQLHLAISEKNFLLNILSGFGSQEIKLDDPEFAQRFVFRGSDEAALRQLVSAPDVRQALLRLKQFEYIEIKDQMLHFEQKAVVTDVAYLTFLLDLTTTLGRAIDQLG